MLVYESAYALGLGPVPFLIISELFPAAVRGKCISFSVIIYLITRTVSESIHGMIGEFGNWSSDQVEIRIFLSLAAVPAVWFNAYFHIKNSS